MDPQEVKDEILREFESTFDPTRDKRPYWHAHLPGRFKTDLTETSVRQAAIRALLDAAKDIREQLKCRKHFWKVVLSIDDPHIENSQIIVFLEPHYYEGFYTRQDEEQRWDPIEGSILKKYGITPEEACREFGFKETLVDVDEVLQGDAWFLEFQ